MDCAKQDLQHLKSQQVTHELGLKGPFQNLLDKAAKRRGWLVPELSTHSGGKRVVPDARYATFRLALNHRTPAGRYQIAPNNLILFCLDRMAKQYEQLTALAGGRPDVYAYSGDCNEILPRDVFPRASYGRYARALCLLDPYNIDLAWDVVEQAGKMGTIEIFLNFMIMDANMNILRHDPDSVDEVQIQQMRFRSSASTGSAGATGGGRLPTVRPETFLATKRRAPMRISLRHTASDL